VLTLSGVLQHGQVVVGGGGQNGGFEKLSVEMH